MKEGGTLASEKQKMQEREKIVKKGVERLGIVEQNPQFCHSLQFCYFMPPIQISMLTFRT